MEFLGDAALKHAIAKILFERLSDNFTESELHDCAKKLITNEIILPQIADDIGLSSFLIKGQGETIVTSKMKADALEAILGAISLDNQSQETLFHVVSKLWEYQLNKVVTEALALKRQTSVSSTLIETPQIFLPQVSNNQAAKTIAKVVTPINNFAQSANQSNQPEQLQLSPRTQKMFSGLGSSNKSMPIDKFEEILSKVPDINRNNIGKKGDTPLMTLLRKKKLRENREIPKIEALLRHGALWEATNKKGQSANDLAKNHNQTIISKLKN